MNELITIGDFEKILAKKEYHKIKSINNVVEFNRFELCELKK